MDFYVDFAMLMSQATTNFLEVSARVLLKVATNGSFRGKRISKINIFEAIILNQKWRSGKKIIYFFIIILECVYHALRYIKINWKRVHALL